MNECQINGTCPEHSTCANTFGSFVCTCNEGFMKNGSVCIGKDLPFIHYIIRVGGMGISSRIVFLKKNIAILLHIYNWGS